MAIASKVKTLATKGFDKAKAAQTSATVALMFAAAQVMPVYCLRTDLDMDTIFGYIWGVVFYAAMYGGLGRALWGVIQIIMSMHRRDGEDVSNAQWMVIQGAALVAARFILGAFLTYMGVTVIMPF